MAKATMAKLADLEPDGDNVNEHTERGLYALTRSVERNGAREAGVLDKFGRVVAGNHRLEVYADLGIDEVMIVDADPAVPLFLRYGDLDLDDPATRELAIAVNRVSQLSINMNPAALGQLMMNGMDLSDWYDPSEQDDILSADEDSAPPPAPEDEMGRRIPDGYVYFVQNVLPEAWQHYRELMAKTEGDTEEQRFASLLATVDPAVWLAHRRDERGD